MVSKLVAHVGVSFNLALRLRILKLGRVVARQHLRGVVQGGLCIYVICAMDYLGVEERLEHIVDTLLIVADKQIFDAVIYMVGLCATLEVDNSLCAVR